MKTKIDTTVVASDDYRQLIEDLKARVLASQASAVRIVNRELNILYWDIARGIVEKQQTLGWGDSVVPMVSADLRRAFPGMRGLSADSVWRMRQFYAEYSDPAFLEHAVPVLEKLPRQFLEQPVPEIASAAQLGQKTQAPETEEGSPAILQAAKQASILSQFVREFLAVVPWGHHIEILKKVKDPAARLWYLRATARYGWSRAVLLNQIKAGAYERGAKEKKTHNFALALPEQFAEQAEEMLKSSYCLDFLGLRRAVRERELEDRLITRLQHFLLELGYGFCFVGRQYRLSVGKKDFSIDLLFYHRFLKALVAFDLKVIAFEPEHAGKMDFYLNVLNDQERGPDDQPSIGIILCAEKDDVEVEYALKSKTNPIGVAVYELQSKLPSELKGKLPTAKQLADVVRAEMEEG